MSYFKQTHIILSVPQSGDIRTLLADMEYFSSLANELIIVENGLNTDLGSIPQILQNIFPKDGKAMFAYILHDYLYKTGKYARSKCDDILEEAMAILDVGWFTRKSVREGIRVGGWVAWSEHRKKDKTPLKNN
jgi:hypothetical protein